MIHLLVLKEKLKSFFARYSIFIMPVIRFVVGFLAFFLINLNVGFVSQLKTVVIPVIMGLISSCVPFGVTAFLAGSFAMIHIAKISLEVAALILIFMLVVMMMYYSFRPGDAYLILLTPLMFFLKIPYVVPLIVGLSGSLVSIIPVSCGIFIYYILLYVKQNAGTLAGSTMSEAVQRFVQILNSIFGNQLMWIMILAFAAAILAVYILKNLSIDYAWYIAIVAGVIAQLVVIFIGDFRFNLSVDIIPLMLGVIISVILSFLYLFFVFSVDYSRTEYTQFEDDDYYYYVKAVPKIAVTAPDLQVHRINTRKTVKKDKE